MCTWTLQYLVTVHLSEAVKLNWCDKLIRSLSESSSSAKKKKLTDLFSPTISRLEEKGMKWCRTTLPVLKYVRQFLACVYSTLPGCVPRLTSRWKSISAPALLVPEGTWKFFFFLQVTQRATKYVISISSSSLSYSRSFFFFYFLWLSEVNSFMQKNLIGWINNLNFCHNTVVSSKLKCVVASCYVLNGQTF